MSVARRSNHDQYTTDDSVESYTVVVQEDVKGGRRREVIPAISLIAICCVTSVFVSAIIPWIIIFSLGWICGHFGMATTLEYSIHTLGVLRYWVGRGPKQVDNRQANGGNTTKNGNSTSTIGPVESTFGILDTSQHRDFQGSNNSVSHYKPSSYKGRIEELDSDNDIISSDDDHSRRKRRKARSREPRPLSELIPEELKWTYPILQGGLDLMFKK